MSDATKLAAEVDESPLVPAPPLRGDVVSRPGWSGPSVPLPDTPVDQWPTNLDLATWQGKALLIAAGNPADIQFTNQQEIPVLATHFLIYPDTFENETTGEIKEGCRVVLFDRDGQTFKTTSEYVAKRLKPAFFLYSEEEWRRGIPFVISRHPSKRHPGGSYHKIRVADR